MLVGNISMSNAHFFQSLFISLNVKPSVKSTKNLVPDESISSNDAEIGSISFLMPTAAPMYSSLMSWKDYPNE